MGGNLARLPGIIVAEQELHRVIDRMKREDDWICFRAWFDPAVATVSFFIYGRFVLPHALDDCRSRKTERDVILIDHSGIELRRALISRPL